MKGHIFIKLPILALALTTSSQAVNLFTGVGADTADLQGVVDNFKSALGNGSTTPNPPSGVNVSDGFRSINWDAAPDAISDPNSFPGDFFNTDFSPRARGMSFTTAGTGFALSATAASGTTTNFGTFNPSYVDEFTTFSPERLFTPVGNNILDVRFFNPANPVEFALVDGFGAVFVDVDQNNLTRMDYYDANDNIIETVFVGAQDKGLSFAGAHFDTEGEVVSRVRIYLGNTVLGANDSFTNDVVVLDDFIAGEPVAVPEPSSAILAALGLAFGFTRRRR